jgi:GT2 family glycosyltransferase
VALVKELAIIILNYRTPQLTLNCLDSLALQIDPERHCVVLVDNASGDGSVELFQAVIKIRQWQPWLMLIVSATNGGFSAGNNLGIQAIDANAYWLLNSDTVVLPGAIDLLLTTLNAHPEVGLLSPRLEWPDGQPQISCFRFHSPVSEIIMGASTGLITQLLASCNVPLPVSHKLSFPQWTSFASVVIRRAVFAYIGLLDDGYFLYYEDVDFCRRAQQVGWGVANLPQARVIHWRGGSSSTKADLLTRKRPSAYLYKSRARYFAKFYGSGGLILANLGWLLGRLVAYIRELMGNKQPHTCDQQEWDIWINWLTPLKKHSN